MLLFSVYCLLSLSSVNDTIKKEYKKADSTWFEFTFPSKFGIIPFNNYIEPIRIKDGHFVGDESGKRIRFFGTTVGWDFLEGQDSVILSAVKYMRSRGINCVRIYPPGIWNSKVYKFNKNKIDRLDYLTKVLSENGVYYSFYTPIYCIYTQREGLSLRLFKGKALLDEKLIKETEIFWDSLLTHKNKYTGVRYVDDPALAFLIMSNENSVSKLWYQKGGREVLKQFWEEYVKEKQISYTPLPKDDNDKNFLTFLKFAAEKDSIYFAEMKGFLRSLGAKVPITCTNDPYSYYEQRVFFKISDFMAVHTYGYYALGNEGGWVRNRSHLIWNNEAPWDFPARMFTVNYQGKPVIVDEWNKGYPVDSRLEATLMVPLFASLYDYDGVFYFSFFAHADYIMKREEFSSFYMTSLEQPFSIQSIFLPVIGSAFREFTIPPYRDSLVLNIGDPKYFTKEQFNYRFNPLPGILKQIYYLKKIIMSFNRGENVKYVKELFQTRDKIMTTYLDWNYKKGYFITNSEKFVGFVGTLDNKYCSSNLIISGISGFFALTVSSLDGKKLEKSEKILITLGSDAINVGDKIYIPRNSSGLIPKRYWFPSKEEQLEMKRIPAISFLKPVNLKLLLKHTKQRNIKCYSLDANGNIREKVPILWKDKFIEIRPNMGIYKTAYFIIKVEKPIRKSRVLEHIKVH